MLNNRISSYTKIKRHSKQALLLFAIIIASGCNEETPIENVSAGSRIAGKIVVGGANVSFEKSYLSITGATVNLMKLNSAGTLEIISAAEVKSDSDGKFIIETFYTGSDDLIITAEKDGKIWKAVLTSKLKAGITVYSQPLTEESTIEAEIFIQAKKLRYNYVQYADISVFITSEIASRLVNDTYSRDLFIQAFEQAAYVQESLVIKGELGGDVNKWKAAISFFTESQATLERDLYFSDTDSESEAAIKKYLDSRIYACKNAGLNASVIFNAITVAQKVFLNVNSYLESDIKFLINKRSGYIKAILLRHITEDDFAELGMSRSIISAGDMLLNKIKDADSEEEINNSFDEYKDVVINHLKSVPGSNADLIINALLAVEEASGIFWTKIKPDILLDIPDLYVLYYEQVYSLLESLIQLTSEPKKQRILSILFTTGSNYKF